VTWSREHHELLDAVCAFPALALAQQFSQEQVDQLTAQIAL
jgi:GAF domain-containing protein